MKPLLLIDVDGVLNPFGRPEPGFRRYRCTLGREVYTVHLNPRHGARLLELALATGAELVWATTWEHHANEWIAPRIGLPPLPVVPMGPVQESELGEMFKTPHVAEYVESRPFVWFDDQVAREDEEYLRERQGLDRFLLIPVDPVNGLTSAHLAMARDWLTLSGFSQGR
ncbi:HAD domain-containing protein [Nonomuraea lactucae]|uniref:HAD domain-containing protein n=1 Tax=Nonomuraea lactucae TaxID=2249762 RepID=UPI000DE5696C|nr:HAD domain-containing protein [Nonomuraea lactucae]